jgi:hypothetical protein
MYDVSSDYSSSSSAFHVLGLVACYGESDL